MVSESTNKMSINSDRATNATKSATNETNTARKPELNEDEKLILSLIEKDRRKKHDCKKGNRCSGKWNNTEKGMRKEVKREENAQNLRFRKL